MVRRLNVRLGILLSAVIFVGIAAFVYYAPPRRQHTLLDRRQELDRQREACIETFRDTPRHSWWCDERYEPRYELLETQEMQEAWLAVGLAVGAGAAGVAVLWLLIYFFYLRPRRSRGI